MSDNIPTKSESSTKWAVDHLVFLEDRFGDSKALKESINEIASIPEQIPALMNNIVHYIAENEGLEQAIDIQIKALQERKDRYKKRSENLRDSMKDIFRAFNLTKLEVPSATVSKVTKTNSKLVIEDEAAIMLEHPDLFTKQAPTLNKATLKQRLLDGEVIEGAKLTDLTTIMIRK